MKAILLISLFFATCFLQAQTIQEYVDWCEAQTKVDTIHVVKYANVVWQQGLLPFTGDTTKLIWVANEKDMDFPEAGIYPAYIFLDTIIITPTFKGYKKFKNKKLSHNY